MKPSKELSEAMEAALQEIAHFKRTDSMFGHREGSELLAQWPTSPGKILFLDIDGVLNSEESRERVGTGSVFAESCIAALNHILMDLDVLMVITSTWRESWSLAEIARFLANAGTTPTRVVGKTSYLSGQLRGAEIEDWLQKAPFQINTFAILDDRDDMGRHSNRLVQTDFKVGLTMDDAKRARLLLQG